MSDTVLPPPGLGGAPGAPEAPPGPRAASTEDQGLEQHGSGGKVPNLTQKHAILPLSGTASSRDATFWPLSRPTDGAAWPPAYERPWWAGAPAPECEISRKFT